jgi:hypothetical protein
MDNKKISVDELVRMFVANSYLNEQRIFKFSDIYKYIERCYELDDDSYHNEVLFPYLIHEAEETIEDMLNNEVISYVYPEGNYGMYRVNNKIDFLELAKLDKEYLEDMRNVFLDINGGKAFAMVLKTSKPRRK